MIALGFLSMQIESRRRLQGRLCYVAPVKAPWENGQSVVMGEQADTRRGAGPWPPQADTSRLKEQQTDSSAS